MKRAESVRVTCDSNWRRRFRRNLRAWYSRHARDLPWRQTSDPYRIWISEIMLQQTTVAAVVPYFDRFQDRFPDIQTLAAASEEEVLRCWEGLGYYSRARNIHKTARWIVQQGDGKIPEDVDELLKLPGIGRYTAGAIASFAFNRRAPIVEANTRRLFARLLGYCGSLQSSEGQRTLWVFAELILPRKLPGRFNQALMELGATVCTASDPACPQCPVKNCCAAFADKRQSDIPETMPRPKTTFLTEAVVAVRKRGRYLLVKREDHERWAGLWDFPRVSLDNQRDSVRSPRAMRQWTETSDSLCHELERKLITDFGIGTQIDQFLTTIQHTVTRYRIRLLCLHAKYGEPANGSLPGSHRWVHPSQFGEYPLSTTGRKLANLLKDAFLAS